MVTRPAAGGARYPVGKRIGFRLRRAASRRRGAVPIRSAAGGRRTWFRLDLGPLVGTRRTVWQPSPGGPQSVGSRTISGHFPDPHATSDNVSYVRLRSRKRREKRGLGPGGRSLESARPSGHPACLHPDLRPQNRPPKTAGNRGFADAQDALAHTPPTRTEYHSPAWLSMPVSTPVFTRSAWPLTAAPRTNPSVVAIPD